MSDEGRGREATHHSSLITHYSSSSFILHPSSFILILHPSSFLLPPSSFSSHRFLHHLLIDRHHAAAFRGIELQSADDAAEGLAQGARAEAFLARRFPGD